MTLAGLWMGCSEAAPASVLQPPASNAALSWRFIGLDAMKTKASLVVFQEAAGLPEYEGFKSNLTARIAESLAKAAVPANGDAAELQKLLTPMAADLIRFPSLFEKENGASNICSLAVELPGERHEIWKQNWDGISKVTKIAGAKLIREGSWTLVSNGSARTILDRARSPGPEVFTFDGDANFLKEIWPELAPKRVTMRVTTQGKNLRSEGKITLEKDAGIKLEPWRIPKETIREPLIGFTAIQGVEERLSKLAIFKDYKAPNQVFIWSADEMPWSSYVAARIEKPTDFIRSAAETISKMGKLTGTLEFNTNTHQLSLRGLPIEIPFIALAPKDPGFVFAGAIPHVNTNASPLPKELAEQVTGRTNIVFYDWEMTGLRLRQIRPLSQTLAISRNKPLPIFSSPAHKWLLAFDLKLGNAITEVTLSGPRELSFVRRSDFGLASLELMALLNWVSGPDVEPTSLLSSPKSQ